MFKIALSPAERSYLHESLSCSSPIRPDARLYKQFRPLEATCSFLPGSNGSARIRMADGAECLASVKAKVVSLQLNNADATQQLQNLIEVDLDINGIRDDSNLSSTIASSLKGSLVKHVPLDKLRLTHRYAFKLFIDIVVLSHSSVYPLTLLSLATYMALKSTKLPLLTSTVDDREIEEQPMFSDDWESSIALFGDSSLSPPLLFVVAVVNDNIFIDPSPEEESVSENGICLTYANGKIISPLQTISLSPKDNTGINAAQILKAHALVKEIGPLVTKSLDEIVSDDSVKTIF
ncbi:BA75_03435T0 [Komagataella pastoris]|uniref:Ribosomal RNA-processing protein 42 n=1 Tax=Komagataella pastoris TaxID=4922 RepID=A0A1B2JGU4_PICPA|nr:BA75_03435T0 [Komagataella pastoris]